MEEKFFRHCLEEQKWGLALLAWGFIGLLVSIILIYWLDPIWKSCAYTLGILALLHAFLGRKTYSDYRQKAKVNQTEVIGFLKEESRFMQNQRKIQSIFFSLGLVWMLLAVVLELDKFSVGIGLAISASFSFSLIWWLMRQWRLGILIGEDDRLI